MHDALYIGRLPLPLGEGWGEGVLLFVMRFAKEC
jgi:hypothetical protein